MPASDEIVETLRAFYQDTIRPETEQLVLRSEARLRSGMEHLGERIDELQRDIDGHFDALYHRLYRLES